MGFRSSSRGWFRFKAPAAAAVGAPPRNRRRHSFESNPERRLVCSACTPGRVVLTGNWFAVQCPRCHGEAVEEMTPDEKALVQLELDRASVARGLRLPPHASGLDRSRKARRRPCS